MIGVRAVATFRGYLLLGMPTNRITQQKLRDYMSKNAPQCEGAFLVVEKPVENCINLVEKSLYVI